MEDIIAAAAEKYGLDACETAQLSDCTANRFTALTAPAGSLPGDDSYLRGWDALKSAEDINRRLCPGCPVEFEAPDKVRVEICSSFAGRIPIIFAESTKDFEQLVTNIVHKGVRPENISKTGASFVSGKTVRFIILSGKPYSNVTAEELGLSREEWAEKSMLIRRSHECTHFFTKQVYGIADNRLHDELMADFCGICDAFGYYRAEWFLKFMGILPGSGGRLIVYTEALAPKVREAVKELVIRAAEGLEKWSLTEGYGSLTGAERIKRMCALGIGGMIRYND